MSSDSPWHIVMPFKPAEEAKTRLVPPADISRAALARAMAADTLTATASAIPPAQIQVVTNDRDIAAFARHLGIAVLADPADGLNAAIRVGLASIREPWRAVLLGDLPALRPGEVLTALDLCASHDRALVEDHRGEGTCLLTTTGPALHPRFGAGSARAHAALSAATPVHVSAPGLRLDVDSADDLRAAATLGLGRHTTRLLWPPSASWRTRSARRQPPLG